MVKSMTGFGKAECKLDNKTLGIEIKSLNSKNLNINTKIDELYSEKEFEIRHLLAEKLQRGKINLSLEIIEQDEQPSSLNEQLFHDYYDKLSSFIKSVGHNPSEELVFQTIAKFPNVIKIEKEKINEAEWEKVKKAINNAIQNIDNYRIQEGKAIKKDLCEKIEIIEKAIARIELFEDQRIVAVKQKLEQKLEELTLPENYRERLEQEIIYYLDKIDINEEKQRLTQHCKFFKETLDNDNSGKKLTFIAQEMGREINTTGAKANSYEIQKIVVEMKDNLEKIKEQLLNIL